MHRRYAKEQRMRRGFVVALEMAMEVFEGRHFCLVMNMPIKTAFDGSSI